MFQLFQWHFRDGNLIDLWRCWNRFLALQRLASLHPIMTSAEKKSWDNVLKSFILETLELLAHWSSYLWFIKTLILHNLSTYSITYYSITPFKDIFIFLDRPIWYYPMEVIFVCSVTSTNKSGCDRSKSVSQVYSNQTQKNPPSEENKSSTFSHTSSIGFPKNNSKEIKP